MKNELIPIIENEQGQPAVSGRELHEFLEVETPYMQWFERMCEYGFEEGKDHCTFLCNGDGFGKAATKTDHAISLDMAKELSMIQRTEKGKQARRYFIECEKQLRLGGGLLLNQVRIDGIPVEIPKGKSFSVTRSKTGVITLRVREETVKPQTEKTKTENPKSVEQQVESQIMSDELENIIANLSKDEKDYLNSLERPEQIKMANYILRSLKNSEDYTATETQIANHIDSRIMAYDVLKLRFVSVIKQLVARGYLVRNGHLLKLASPRISKIIEMDI